MLDHPAARRRGLPSPPPPVARPTGDAPPSPGAALNPFTLVFRDPDLETAFRAEHYRDTLRAVRFSLLLGLLLYGAFGLLDPAIIPEVAPTAWLIRYLVVCPMALVLLALTYRPGFDRYAASLTAALGGVAGLGIEAMILLARPPGSYLYYAGLMLVCGAIYTLFHLRLALAVSVAWGLVLAYLAGAVAAGTPPTILLSNGFFLLGMNVVGMIACHSTERVLRAAFLDRRTIETLAQHDPLTGLLNRRAFFALAEADLARCAAEGRPVSVVMLDVDHFKAVNDRLGHAAGDQVLRAVASALGESLRDGGWLCRYGGEEFAVLLPDTGAVEARRVSERLRAGVADLVLAGESGCLAVTASAGLATWVPEGRATLDSLLLAADRALYAAKAAGRNAVVLAS